MKPLLPVLLTTLFMSLDTAGNTHQTSALQIAGLIRELDKNAISELLYDSDESFDDDFGKFLKVFRACRANNRAGLLAHKSFNGCVYLTEQGTVASTAVFTPLIPTFQAFRQMLQSLRKTDLSSGYVWTHEVIVGLVASYGVLCLTFSKEPVSAYCLTSEEAVDALNSRSYMDIISLNRPLWIMLVVSSYLLKMKYTEITQRFRREFNQ